MNLRRTSALVTGGTRGIGRELVSQLAALGATVYFCGRDAAAVAGVQDAVPGSVGHVSDLTDPADRAKLVEEVIAAGPLTVLANNAGVGRIIDLTSGRLVDPMPEVETN